jgi:hypothetical protein
VWGCAPFSLLASQWRQRKVQRPRIPGGRFSALPHVYRRYPAPLQERHALNNLTLYPHNTTDRVIMMPKREFRRLDPLTTPLSYGTIQSKRILPAPWSPMANAESIPSYPAVIQNRDPSTRVSPRVFRRLAPFTDHERVLPHSTVVGRPVTNLSRKAVRSRELRQEKKDFVTPAANLVAELGILDPGAQVLNLLSSRYISATLHNTLTCLGCCQGRVREHSVRQEEVWCSHARSAI